MVQVSRSTVIPASASTIWGTIGGFQSLPDWHPAVQASAREDRDGTEYRRLDLGGGAEILEKSLGAGDQMSYGYEIVEPGPLPIEDYRATITVAPLSNGHCVVVWTSTFDATAEGADGAIVGIYEAGFGALQERFG